MYFFSRNAVTPQNIFGISYLGFYHKHFPTLFSLLVHQILYNTRMHTHTKLPTNDLDLAISRVLKVG